MNSQHVDASMSFMVCTCASPRRKTKTAFALLKAYTIMLNDKERTLLGAKGIATRNKGATRGSWPYY